MKFIKLITCLSFILLLTGCKNEKFSLEDKYYKEGSLVLLDTQTLDKLIKDKESFALFIYQPLCETSSGFESLLNNFTALHHMSFYKIAFSDIKNIDLGKKIKYYPSFIVYKNGKIVDYLEADKDEDINRYKNIDEFRNWLSNYINIGEPYKNVFNNNEVSKEQVEIDF